MATLKSFFAAVDGASALLSTAAVLLAAAVAALEAVVPEAHAVAEAAITTASKSATIFFMIFLLLSNYVWIYYNITISDTIPIESFTMPFPILLYFTLIYNTFESS
jgi:uncharacterized membrane protein